jgi:hypothetical protein
VLDYMYITSVSNSYTYVYTHTLMCLYTTGHDTRLYTDYKLIVILGTGHSCTDGHFAKAGINYMHLCNQTLIGLKLTSIVHNLNIPCMSVRKRIPFMQRGQ